MRDQEPLPSLDELDARLRKARAAHDRGPPSAGIGHGQAGLAYRAFVELLAGVLVGGGLGWYLDQWLGTRPWVMLALLLLGFAAGVLNTWRTATRAGAAAEAAEGRERSRPDGAG